MCSKTDQVAQNQKLKKVARKNGKMDMLRSISKQSGEFVESVLKVISQWK